MSSSEHKKRECGTAPKRHAKAGTVKTPKTTVHVATVEPRFEFRVSDKTLSSVLDRIAERKINVSNHSIRASAAPSAAHCNLKVVRLVTNNASGTARILRELGVPFTDRSVVDVTLGAVPGQMRVLLRAIAKSKIHAQSITSSEGGAVIVVHAQDLSRLVRVVRDALA